MKKTILLATLVAALIPSVRAQNATSSPLADLTVTGAFDYESQYVFRGKKVSNSSFQPSVDLGYALGDYGVLHAYIWTNQPIATRGQFGAGPNQANEIDVGTYYVLPLDKWGATNLSLDVGYQYYWYPEAKGNPGFLGRSNELHLGFTYNTKDILVIGGTGYNINPSIFYYHDFNLDQNTIQFSLSYSWDLESATGVKGLAFAPYASIGWNGANKQFGDQAGPGPNWKNGYVYWLLSGELQYKLNSWCTAFAGLRYSGNNDGTTNGFAAINPQLGGTQSSLWAGFGLRYGM